VSYVFKNGMRYLAEDKVIDGCHYHSDISTRIGKNIVRTLKLGVNGRHGAGVPVPFKIEMQKIHFVKLNNQILQHKIDFIIADDNRSIAFTFNLVDSDKIEIEGIS
jgi:hypothetical protein